MIDKVNARKTAKNLLLGHTCSGCAFSDERVISLSPLGPGDYSTHWCTFLEGDTNEHDSCMFWLDSDPSENWLEYVKRNGFLLDDIKKHWIN